MNLKEKILRPFLEGNSANKKFYHTFDEFYRQSSVTGEVEYNFSIWSMEATTYKGEAYAKVVSRDIPDKDIEPRAFRYKTSDDIPVETSMRLIIYIKFDNFIAYHKFFKRFQGPGAKSSHQLIHDFDHAVLDVHTFSEDGKLLTGMREDVLKLTSRQWRSLVCVLNKE